MARTVAEMPSRRLGLGMGAVTALALVGIALGALALVIQRDGAAPSAVTGDVTYQPSFAGVREHFAAPSAISVEGIEAWGQRYQAQALGNSTLLPTTHFREQGAELSGISVQGMEAWGQRYQAQAPVNIVLRPTTSFREQGAELSGISVQGMEAWGQRYQAQAVGNTDLLPTTSFREAVR